jgi:hypothetical protein
LLWACGEAVYHGGEYTVEEAIYLKAAGKERGRGRERERKREREGEREKEREHFFV